MALARVTKVGTGSTSIFAVEFALGYLDLNDVSCRVGTENDGAGNPVYRTITPLTGNLLQVSGAVPALNVPVVFQRFVDSSMLRVDWQDDADISEDTLNIMQKQSMMVNHQTQDAVADLTIVANNATTVANAATDIANSTIGAVEDANEKADAATISAAAAVTTAAAADTKANTAISTANTAASQIAAATTTANAADAKADTAITTANEAKELAEAAVGGSFDSDVITNVSTVTGVKVTDALNTLKTSVDAKASQTALDGLTATVGTKASASSVTALAGTVSANDAAIATVGKTGSYNDLSNKPTLGTAAARAVATSGEYLSKSTDKVLDADGVWDAAAYTSLTDGATIAVNLSNGIHFTCTLGGNRFLAFPTGIKEGQQGSFEFKQDATGSRTLSYGSGYKWQNGVVGILSTAPNAVDEIYFTVRGPTEVRLSMTKAWA